MNKVQERRSRILAVRGTLVMAVGTKDGLFIAADKRTNDPVRGTLDTKTKIIQLEPKVAIASTGTPQFYSKETRSNGKEVIRKVFDADDEVINYCKSINVENTAEFFTGLSQHLDKEFQKVLHRQSEDQWPPSGDGEDNALFQVIFFIIDESEMMGISRLIFQYRKEPPSVIRTKTRRYPAEYLKKALPFVAGDTDVFFEIEKGNDAQYDDIRSDPSLTRLLKERPDVETVTIEEAETFCRRIIKVTSKNTHKVGPTYDSAIIDHQGGFRWLSRNRSVNDESSDLPES